MLSFVYLGSLNSPFTFTQEVPALGRVVSLRYPFQWPQTGWVYMFLETRPEPGGKMASMAVVHSKASRVTVEDFTSPAVGEEAQGKVECQEAEGDTRAVVWNSDSRLGLRVAGRPTTMPLLARSSCPCPLWESVPGP